MAHTIITVARQFGSGGHEVAETLAKSMNIAFYDKELIAMAAKKSGLSESLFDGMEERPTNSLLFSLVMGLQNMEKANHHYESSFNSDGIFRIQSQVVRNIADKGPAVIVGRCSDYILRDYEKAVHVFIHANMDWRTARIMERYRLKEKEAVDKINKIDKNRSAFYNFYTNRVWGNVENYHLAIDTSAISIERATDVIRAYVDAI